METTREVETTATDLGSLLGAGDGAVVTLVAGDTRLVVHRAVLAARSPVFAEMFKHNLESSDGQVRIPDVEGPVLRQLLAYCYTLQPPQLPDMALKLLVAADKYRVSVLKAECERQVAAQLSAETAAAAAVVTVRHSCTLLRPTVIAYMKTHIFEVMATEGWADTVRTQPEDWVRLNRLLSETSVPAPAVGGASPPPTDQPHSDGSQTPASAALPTAASCHSPPPDDTAVPRLCAPAPAGVGSSPSTSTQPHSDQGDCRHSRSPPSAAAPTAAPSCSPPPNDAAFSRLRSLSAEENNRRLVEAAEQGAVGELEALLAAGVDAGAADEWGQTALHWAAEEGHEEAARWLLAAGVAVHARDNRGQTPLYCAALGGHAAVVGLLLAAGADHRDWTSSGWTALHCAAAYGHTEAAAALLEAGADRAARDNGGKTPLELARQNRHWQVVQLLQSR